MAVVRELEEVREQLELVRGCERELRAERVAFRQQERLLIDKRAVWIVQAIREEGWKRVARMLNVGPSRLFRMRDPHAGGAGR